MVLKLERCNTGETDRDQFQTMMRLEVSKSKVVFFLLKLQWYWSLKAFPPPFIHGCVSQQSNLESLRKRVQQLKGNFDQIKRINKYINIKYRKRVKVVGPYSLTILIQLQLQICLVSWEKIYI